MAEVVRMEETGLTEAVEEKEEKEARLAMEETVETPGALTT